MSAIALEKKETKKKNMDSNKLHESLAFQRPNALTLLLTPSLSWSPHIIMAITTITGITQMEKIVVIRSKWQQNMMTTE